MDYIDWFMRVLSEIVRESRATLEAREHGVDVTDVARARCLEKTSSLNPSTGRLRNTPTFIFSSKRWLPPALSEKQVSGPVTGLGTQPIRS